MRSHIWRATTVLLALALLAANLLLQRRNHELYGRLEALEKALVPEVGSKVSLVWGIDLKGNPVSKDYGGQDNRSLLLVFSPVCGYCKLNWPYWQRLVREMPTIGVVYADNTGSVTEQFLSRLNLPPGPVVKLNSGVSQQYRLLSTPTTVVIGPKGEVVYAYAGVMNETELRRVKDLLRPEPASAAKL